ncbi:ribonuclease P protein component [Metabacillus malikii]|uniref:Ribonuclease P protein component n=1 Tax=Metabacillus malikii TaxID=1504265 RepID=A0ABT9ZLL3_9BACI|nr:ribonuclease P protein component [Metabacillus malikii]MDQ0233186.1 ribonuclease P protein component [Metabacillus malikii]
MKKKYRIKKNKDFQSVFKRGKSIANRQFVIYILEKPEQSQFRIGLSVSKKIGNAVTRNRVKRLIRQVFLEEKERILGRREYIIIARKPAADMNYYEVKSSLQHLFRKGSLYRSKK